MLACNTRPDGGAEIMEEGEHAQLLPFESIQLVVLRAELPFGPTESECEADNGHG